MPQDLFIDVESFSSVDLKKCGAYKYVESPDFEILIVGYAFDHGPVKVVDLKSGEKLPDEFIKAMYDPNVRKHAHNAVFERICFARIGIVVPIDQWYCTEIKSAYCGLPLKLDLVSKALDLKDKKLATGTALINYFSKPCKPSKANGMRVRNLPEHAPEKWEQYKVYNSYDVLSEREIYYLLDKYKIPEFDRELYIVDQMINDRGILIDMDLAKSAIYINEKIVAELGQRIQEITGVDNPNSGAQLKDWLSTRTGTLVDSLNKDVIPILKERFANMKDVIEVLTLQEQMSMTSIKKYYTMVAAACNDGRVKGTFQFYGANRTGRWAGRLLQLQNLSKNHTDDLDAPRDIVKQRDVEWAKIIYGDVTDLLSQLVRTALIAPEGYTFAVADFSAIEARVVSWLAGEEWALEVFRGHGKIYEATGSRMFNVPIEKITKGSDLRAKSKISVLALGFGGSIGALDRMDKGQLGLTEQEKSDIVTRWRAANPHIVKMWWDFEQLAKNAIKYQEKFESNYRGVTFDCDGDNLMITLPSGRTLFYREPCVRQKPMPKGGPMECIFYKGMDQIRKTWGELDTYGGKLTENIVQAIARDLIGGVIINLTKADYPITMHVHDEVIAEIPQDGHEQENYDRMVRIMKTSPSWASDLPLNADGYITKFYKKD